MMGWEEGRRVIGLWEREGAVWQSQGITLGELGLG